MEDITTIPSNVGDSAAGSSAQSVQDVRDEAEVMKNAGLPPPDQPVDKSRENSENLLEHIEHVIHDVAVSVNRTLRIGRHGKTVAETTADTRGGKEERGDAGDREERVLQVTATEEEEQRTQDLSPDAAATKTNEQSPEYEPLTEGEPEEKSQDKLEEKGSEKSSIFSQMFKRMGEFFSINEGRKKRQPTDGKDSDVSSNPFLPDDDTTITDVTVPEDRVSI